MTIFHCTKHLFVYIFTDVDVEKPDEKSIMTYVAQFLKAYPEAGEDPAVCIFICIKYFVFNILIDIVFESIVHFKL